MDGVKMAVLNCYRNIMSPSFPDRVGVSPLGLPPKVHAKFFQFGNFSLLIVLKFASENIFFRNGSDNHIV